MNYNNSRTVTFSARFPVELAQQIDEFLTDANVSKSELIIAGTLAEVDRRMNEIKEPVQESPEPALSQ